RRKKVVKKDFRFWNTIVERICNYREVYTLATCNHPNIVKFVGAGPNTRVADVRYVVMERATDTSLKDLIYSRIEYGIWHVMLWTLHLADGLDYLHSRDEQIIHRDLKPANMLLFDRCTTLKISDFGTSKIFEAGKEDLQSVNQGSLLYMAPEVQQREFWHLLFLVMQEAVDRKCGLCYCGVWYYLDVSYGGEYAKDKFYACYTKAVDVYSMMVSVWEMLTRRLDVDVNPRTVTISSCPPFLERLLTRGTAVDPCERPLASEVVCLFDSIMRYVCKKATSELYIDFEDDTVRSVSPTTETCTEAATGCIRESELDTSFPNFEIVDCLQEVGIVCVV
ncbi:unnamed protein product, partial [Hydatigera taeniaeformis]|uniref:Protein kinase domain-containing protein n=1 Tax=Hydatigena taeniaeformis TaxID=6205 RepID=A0A0R3X6D7_HYDTA